MLLPGRDLPMITTQMSMKGKKYPDKIDKTATAA